MQQLKRSQNTAPIARGRSLTGGHHLMPHYEEIPDSDWAENSRNGFIQVCKIFATLYLEARMRDCNVNGARSYYMPYTSDHRHPQCHIHRLLEFLVQIRDEFIFEGCRMTTHPPIRMRTPAFMGASFFPLRYILLNVPSSNFCSHQF